MACLKLAVFAQVGKCSKAIVDVVHAIQAEAMKYITVSQVEKDVMFRGGELGGLLSCGNSGRAGDGE